MGSCNNNSFLWKGLGTGRRHFWFRDQKVKSILKRRERHSKSHWIKLSIINKQHFASRAFNFTNLPLNSMLSNALGLANRNHSKGTEFELISYSAQHSSINIVSTLLDIIYPLDLYDKLLFSNPLLLLCFLLSHWCSLAERLTKYVYS